MPWPEYTGPDKANKGMEGGACNRFQCQDEPANWYNHGSFKWYCDNCREAIQFDHVNLRDWELRWQPKLGHPMFETREQIDAREAATPKPDLDEQLRGIVEPYFGWPRGREKQQSSSLQRMLRKAKS